MPAAAITIAIETGRRRARMRALRATCAAMPRISFNKVLTVMVPMSDFRSRSKPSRIGAPTAALDAALDGTSADPIRRAMWLDALDRRLVPLLPPALAPHARLANVDRRRLVFLVDSPIWHARLRLSADTLLDAARSIGLDVDDIVVRTSTQPLRPAPPEARGALANPPSAVARDTLRSVLASLRPPEGGKDEGV
ncbi:DciA family protein [Luteimonas sp. TWI662]|uniref:DUF721 domain-containing protein n=2 Tax=Luteimonas TaxID=83614 RepID=UPI003208DEB6